MKKKARIRVFRMNDCDWLAGTDLESCIRYYLKEHVQVPDTKESREEHLDEPRKLTNSQMAHISFTDFDGQWGEPGKKYTFQEALELTIKDRPEFPILFASTEY